jgi:hypothetical protein
MKAVIPCRRRRYLDSPKYMVEWNAVDLLLRRAIQRGNKLATRIFDFRPSDEGALVEKILVSIHKMVDTHLPTAETAPKRYSKTLFSEEESTALVRAAIDHEKELESNPVQKTPPAPQFTKPQVPIPQYPDARQPSAPVPKPLLVSVKPPLPAAQSAAIPIPRDSKSSSVAQHVSGVSDMRHFSQGYEYTEPKVPGGGKDLFLIVLGLVVLIALAAGYWYIFEAGKS